MTEQAVLASLNECLLAQGQPAIAGVGELFGRVSRNYLATFPELDHYPQRKSDSGQYLGVWSDLAGSPVHWPDVPGPRLFAYLKSGPYLTPVLDGLRESGLPCIVFGPALPDVRRWQGENIRFFEQPLDMTEVCAQCDRAIVHAGHGSTASLLLAGKPILQLPMNVEQYHTALNTERLGAGRMAPIDDTILLSFALNAGKHQHGMDDLASRYFNHTCIIGY